MRHAEGKNKERFCWIPAAFRALNSGGELIDHIEVPEKWSANVSFGGADHQTLFITACESLYSIRLRVKGGNPAK